MRVLAIDHGSARAGTAICDPTGTIVRPLGVISPPDAARGRARWRPSAGAELVVVGLPVSLDGSEGEQAEAARAFRDRARGNRRRAGRDLRRAADDADGRGAADAAAPGAAADALAAAHLLESYSALRGAGSRPMSRTERRSASPRTRTGTSARRRAERGARSSPRRAEGALARQRRSRPSSAGVSADGARERAAGPAAQARARAASDALRPVASRATAASEPRARRAADARPSPRRHASARQPRRPDPGRGDLARTRRGDFGRIARRGGDRDRCFAVAGDLRARGKRLDRRDGGGSTPTPAAEAAQRTRRA